MTLALPVHETAETLARLFADRASAHDQAARFAHDDIADLRAAGLTAPVVPRRLGVDGAGLLRAAALVGILARGDLSKALVLAMQFIQHGLMHVGRCSQQAWNAVLIAAVYDGVARAAQTWFVTFVRDRRPGSLAANLATLPRFQEAAGENARLLGVNGRLIRALAGEGDGGASVPVDESGFLNLTVTENAIQMVQRAVEFSGNPGLSRNNPLERHLRDVLRGRIHWPQGDAVLASAGRAALGL